MRVCSVSRDGRCGQDIRGVPGVCLSEVALDNVMWKIRTLTLPALGGREIEYTGTGERIQRPRRGLVLRDWSQKQSASKCCKRVKKRTQAL